jgi:ligand-binding sensor domain-containing protein
MRISLAKFIVLFSVFLSFKHSSAQEWQLYNTSNSGIGADWVNNIVVDRDGVIWTTGSSILNRYDGKTWTVFSLPLFGSIVDLALKNDGNLLVATSTGLFEFNIEYQTFINITPEIFPYDWTNCVAVDGNDGIWVGQGVGGARLFHYDGDQWLDYSDENYVQGISMVYSIDCFENNVWIGVDHSLHNFDGTTWSKYTEDNSPLTGGLVMEVKCDNTGKVWIGTGMETISENNGSLTTFDQNTWQVADSTDCSFLWRGANAISPSDTSCWFACDYKGFVHFDGQNYHTYDTTNSIIPSHYVHAVATDDRGNVFMGTQKGLVIYNPDSININVPDFNTLISIYPNPTLHEVNITFNSRKPEDVTVTIHDINGAIVADEKKMIDSGPYKLVVDVSHLSAGVYILHLFYRDKEWTERIVIE